MAEVECIYAADSKCNNVVIVGLTGAKTSGKSEVAEILVRHHGFTRFRFGSGLKDMLYAIGLTVEELEGSKKDVPNKMLGNVTPRYLMETLGDSWGRRIVHPNIWVYILSNHIIREFIKNKSIKIVIDDVRYPNEAEYAQAIGGKLWRVQRPGLKPVSLWFPRFMARWSWLTRKHVSEFFWNRLPVDHIIENDTNLAGLRYAVDAAVKSRLANICEHKCAIPRFWTPKVKD